MDEMTKIYEMVVKISDKQSDMNETLVRNTVTLEEHVKRTNILQHKVEKVEDHIVRVDSFLDKLKGSWKLIVCIGVIAGIAATIYKLI